MHSYAYQHFVAGGRNFYQRVLIIDQEIKLVGRDVLSKQHGVLFVAKAGSNAMRCCLGKRGAPWRWKEPTEYTLSIAYNHKHN